MRKTLAVLISAALLTIFASGCTSTPAVANEQVIPPIDSVTVKTLDGNGVVTLVMRTYDNALSMEEIEQIKTEAQNILANMYEPDGPKVISTPETSGEARFVAFCYAVYTDRIPNSFWGTAGNENSGEPIYRHAQEWFIQELAGIEHH
jgi:hypothetical protein